MVTSSFTIPRMAVRASGVVRSVALSEELRGESFCDVESLDEGDAVGEEARPRARQPREQEGGALEENEQESEVQQDPDGSRGSPQA